MGHRGRLAAFALIACAVLASRAIAETVEEELPFLADDAAYTPATPPLLVWPERLHLDDVAAHGWRWQRDPEKFWEEPDLVPFEAAPFPGMETLFAPLGEFVTQTPGRVTFTDDGSPRVARAERLLAAVRNAFARDIAITVELIRGDKVLLRLVRATRDGALMLADERADSAWPADHSAAAVLVAPVSILVRTGTRLGVIVDQLSPDRFVVDLDVHRSEVAGERVFEDADLRRVAPIVETTHFRGAIPVRNGEPTIASFGELSLRVTARRDARTLPEGVRTLRLPRSTSLLPDAVRVRPRQLPLVYDAEPLWTPSATQLTVPPRWTAFATEHGLRLAPVFPGALVVEGESEGSLDAFEEFAQGTLSEPVVRANHGDWALDLPVVSGRPFTFGSARLVPAVAAADVEVQTTRATVSTTIAYEGIGMFVHGQWDGGVLAVRRDVRSGRIETASKHTVSSADEGGSTSTLHADSVKLTQRSDVVRLRDGEGLRALGDDR